MVLGSVMAVGIFLATITFLFTTPGVGEATAGGFPVCRRPANSSSKTLRR
jgi:uncharacterized membrane protein YkgB